MNKTARKLETQNQNLPHRYQVRLDVAPARSPRPIPWRSWSITGYQADWCDFAR